MSNLATLILVVHGHREVIDVKANLLQHLRLATTLLHNLWKKLVKTWLQNPLQPFTGSTPGLQLGYNLIITWLHLGLATTWLQLSYNLGQLHLFILLKNWHYLSLHLNAPYQAIFYNMCLKWVSKLVTTRCVPPLCLVDDVFGLESNPPKWV